jgi:succinate-acetate transporter protein
LIAALLTLNYGGYIPHENFAAFFAIPMAGGVTQIIAGVIGLKRGEAFAGNLLLTMACLFMLAPGITILLTTV